jgi:RND family efflux transporter MFP subunit
VRLANLKLSRSRIIQAIIVAFLIVGAVSIFLRATAPKSAETITLSAGPAEQSLSVVGRVRPINLVSIQAERAGAVVQLLHDEGDQVSKGDLLARIRADQEQAAVAVTTAQIANLEAQLSLAVKSGQRLQTLFNQGWVTQAAMEEANAAVAAARASLDAGRASSRQAVAAAREFNVFAPMTGTILARPIDEGQVVSTATVLFEIGSAGPVEIEAEIDEYYADQVPISADVIISPSGSAQRFGGRITEISPRIDSSTGGRLMRFSSATDHPDLRPGRSVNITIIVKEYDQALSLPRSSLFKNQGQNQVYVIEDGNAAPRNVAVVDWPGSNVIITDGLEAGAVVILDPLSVRAGEKVDPVARSADQAN